MEALCKEGLKGGGDWCDLYFENSEYYDLLLRDSEVSSGGCQIDRGCGIRVLKGEKTGYAYSENLQYQSLVQAAKAAASIAGVQGGTSFNAGRIAVSPTPNLYPMQQDWRESSTLSFIPFLRKIESRIRELDSRVLKVIAMLSWSVSDIMMYNSLGELTSDERPLGSVTIRTIFSQGDKTENSRVSLSFRKGSEMVSESTIETLARQAVEGIDLRFEARRPKGGRMSVVLGAGASGILLHEAMGHAFEADFNRKGQSIFSDKMGKRVCRKGINIVDDGTLKFNRGACLYDDEGVPGQKTYMVADGVLNSYLHDRISASAYKVPPTGNGRRESFRYNPIPRMRATYMENGSDGSAEDLIASVKSGIYVDKFSNGEVKIGEGDFTFYVKSGRLIENGRLSTPVKDINITGNGPRVLADIEAVGSDLKMADSTWICGKEQDVPVSCGMPSVLVRELTVGGE